MELDSVIIWEVKNSVFNPVDRCIVSGGADETISFSGGVGEVFEDVGFGEEVGAQENTPKFVLRALEENGREWGQYTDSTRGFTPGMGSLVGALDPVAARARRERRGIESLISD